MASCVIDGCEKPQKGAGLCASHYMRQRRYGTPTGGGREYVVGGRECAADGCTERAKAKGFCPIHYMRWKKHGDPLATSASKGLVHGNRRYGRDETCCVEGCGRPVKAKGFCASHYQRNRQTGTPGDVTFSRGVGRHYDSNGYVVVYVDRDGRRVKVLEHRLVMEQLLGRELDGLENVHHRNGVRDDNRPENLELWVKPQPQGQRVADLVAWVVDRYPAEVRAALQRREEHGHG